MLHAVWNNGLVVFGWRGRALDRRAVQSLASALFVESYLLGETKQVSLVPPGRKTPVDVVAIDVPVQAANEAFLMRQWVPWRSLSPSIAWFARIARRADEAVQSGLIVPALIERDKRWYAEWQPMIDDILANELQNATLEMPEVVRSMMPAAAPWQITQAAMNAFTDDATRMRAVDTNLGDPAPRNRGANAVVTRRFLTSLTMEDAEVHITDIAQRQAVEQLATQLARWTQPLSGRSPLASLVPSVRVTPPTEVDVHEDHPWYGMMPEDMPWLMELGLNPVHDPSLLVQATDIWSGAFADVLGVEIPQVHTALRLASRRIASIAPTIGNGFDYMQPGVSLVAPEHLVHALTIEAPRLEAAGVRVLLPAFWGKRATAKVKGIAKPAQPAITPAGLEVKNLVSVDWNLVLGESNVDLETLAKLAAAKAPIVLHKGQWIAFDPEQVRRALTTLTAHTRAPKEMSPLELMRLAASVELTLDTADDTWINELLDGLPDDKLEEIHEPPSFNGTLRPYQRRGLGWLAFLHRLGLGGCLADDMGLGKTAQLLALMAHERHNSHGPTAPTLVVCPLSVIRNWETESARFTPELNVMTHHGPDRLHGPDLADAIAKHDLVITTYALVARDVDDLAHYGWGRVVADEAQHVKNNHTAAARALRKIKAHHKLALTGTPVENRLSELWSVCDLVNPGLLGTATDFRESFAVPIERHKDADKTDELRALVQPFLLRRSKADRALVPELPPKVEQVAWATLTREQATLYRSVVDDLLRQLDKSLDGMNRRGAILASITRLKQICNHPAHLLKDGSALAGRSGKLTRFDEILDDAIDADEASLVFTQYREMGVLLAKHINERLGIHAPFLHGGVSKTGRDKMVDNFQAGTGGPILIVSLKAGGSGLNLTEASQVIHYDRWWNPAVENQASDRAWRIGQTRTVMVHKLACQGTIEERIDTLIAGKRDLAERVVGDGEAWLTELSTAEIRDLIMLRDYH